MELPTCSEVRLALPSKGRMEEETLRFLADCGFEAEKPGPRHYRACLPSLPGVSVVFLRARDIPRSLASGDVHLGITGLDSLREAEADGWDGITVVHEALGFGRCRLALAVPEAWADVSSVAGLAVRFAGRTARVATRYPNLAAAFLEASDACSFEITGADGALESAPAVGYADLIADLVSTGETIRENGLKLLAGGTILESEAVLAAGTSALDSDPAAMEAACTLLECIEARMRGRGRYLVFANMRGGCMEEVAARMIARPLIAGLQGPTISPVFGPGGRGWWAVNVVVPSSAVYRAIRQMREAGGSGVVVTPARYVFEEQSERCRRLAGPVRETAVRR
jgi:ATP phosphoribosyltransferase